MKIATISAIIGLSGTALSAPISDGSVAERNIAGWTSPLPCPMGQHRSLLLGICVSSGSFSGIVAGDKEAGEAVKSDEEKRSATSWILPTPCPVGQYRGLLGTCTPLISPPLGIVAGDKEASEAAKRDEEERSITGSILPLPCPMGQRYSYLLRMCVSAGSFSGIVAGDKEASEPVERDEEKRSITGGLLPLPCPIGQRYSYLLRMCVSAGGFPGIVAGDKEASEPAKGNEEKRSGTSWILPSSCPVGQRYSVLLQRCVSTGSFPGIVAGGKEASEATKRDEEERSITGSILPLPCPMGQRYSYLLRMCVSTGSFPGIVAGKKDAGIPAKLNEAKRQDDEQSADE